MCLWSVLMLPEVFGIYVLIFLRFKKKKKKRGVGEQNRRNLRLHALYWLYLDMLPCSVETVVNYCHLCALQITCNNKLYCASGVLWCCQVLMYLKSFSCF